MTEPLRRPFASQLEDIHQELVRLASTVTELVPRVTEVLLSSDLVDADAIIDGDDDIDARSVELEERCYLVLALQQPMAGDLRAIVAAVRMIGEVERSADLVVNLCKATRRMYGTELNPRLRGIITRMGEQAHLLFRLAVDAYAEGDAPLAAALRDMDDALDQAHADFIQAIFEAHAEGGLELRVAVQLALVGRFYERIGDHAVNVGERVRYMVTGWLPEHVNGRGHDPGSPIRGLDLREGSGSSGIGDGGGTATP
jgi:phosphate transport system protein